MDSLKRFNTSLSIDNRGSSILLIPLLAIIVIAALWYFTPIYFPGLINDLDKARQELPGVISGSSNDIAPDKNEVNKTIKQVLADRQGIKEFGIPIRSDETYLITLKNGGTLVATQTKVSDQAISFTEPGGMSVSLNKDSIKSISRIKAAAKIEKKK